MSTRTRHLSTCTCNSYLVLRLGLLERNMLCGTSSAAFGSAVLHQQQHGSSSLKTLKLCAQYSHLGSIQVTGTPSMHLRKYLQTEYDDTDNSCRLSFRQKNKGALDLLFEPAMTALSVQHQTKANSRRRQNNSVKALKENSTLSISS